MENKGEGKRKKKTRRDWKGNKWRRKEEWGKRTEEEMKWKEE